MKKLTTIEFIEKAKNIHGDKYDYSLVEYKYSKSKVKIICKIHGIFEQIPNCHLDNQGCSLCGFKKTAFLKTKDINKFLIDAKLKHGNRYDYSEVIYVNNHSKIKIGCKLHGYFYQCPKTHINGQRCPECGKINQGNKRKSTLTYFIEKANYIHNNKYDYSKVIYVESHTNIIIICDEHGEFMQMPYNHLNGSGCPICKQSKGEKKIRNYLEKNSIEYISEKTFNNCKNKYQLPFDYYLPKTNILIEYDGIQHFKPVNYFGGNDGLMKRQNYDNIKNKFVEDNNMNLIRIRYDQIDQIDNILKERIN